MDVYSSPHMVLSTRVVSSPFSFGVHGRLEGRGFGAWGFRFTCLGLRVSFFSCVAFGKYS